MYLAFYHWSPLTWHSASWPHASHPPFLPYPSALVDINCCIGLICDFPCIRPVVAPKCKISAWLAIARCSQQWIWLGFSRRLSRRAWYSLEAQTTSWTFLPRVSFPALLLGRRYVGKLAQTYLQWRIYVMVLAESLVPLMEIVTPVTGTTDGNMFSCLSHGSCGATSSLSCWTPVCTKLEGCELGLPLSHAAFCALGDELQQEDEADQLGMIIC